MPEPLASVPPLTSPLRRGSHPAPRSHQALTPSAFSSTSRFSRAAPLSSMQSGSYGEEETGSAAASAGPAAAAAPPSAAETYTLSSIQTGS